MNKIRLIIVLIAAPMIFMIGPGVLAQETGKTSQKFDEFIAELDHEDLMARLDNFAITFQQQPKAKAHIIVYRSRRDLPAVSLRYAGLAKDYLVNTRGIARRDVVTVDGGMTGCLTYELWIVPEGATPPERRFTYTFPLRPRRR